MVLLLRTKFRMKRSLTNTEIIQVGHLSIRSWLKRWTCTRTWWADLMKNCFPLIGSTESRFREKYRALGHKKNGVQHSSAIYLIPWYTRLLYIRSTLMDLLSFKTKLYNDVGNKLPMITRTTRTPAFWGYPPPPNDYPYHWVILDPKSKVDKVKVTNLKNSPKFQYEIETGITRDTPSEVAW